MRLHTLIAGAAALLFTSAGALPHDEHADEGHGGHAGHAAVGRVNFPNSCAPEVQEDFLRGVAMLHSFWYSAGERTFREVLARDPTCAIANWGIAALLMNNPLAGVGSTPKDAEKARAAIDEGRRTGAKTQRERDYIESIDSYYRDWASRPERARQESRAKAFEALAARYPEDDEAQIFSALYIAGTQGQADQTYAAYAKSAAILEREYAKYPDHPGIAHYLIHVHDAPPLAAQGLGVARRYAGLAPDAPHALHMPSHIFTRVGAWEESAATNHRAYLAAIKGNEFGEAYHASDYAVYAELQMARDAAALGDIGNAFKVNASATPPPPMSYAAAAMPARYALERGDWSGAMALEPPRAGPPYADAITWFARALGAARMGDAAAAERNAAELDTRHKALVEAGNAYWAKEVDVQRRTVAGWIALAQGRKEEALGLMREAADLEDRNEKHIVTPGRMLPARELLGDMLLEAGQPALALREYEASQTREPNRFRGILGAARAAEAAGERDKAAAYYGKLLALAKDADTERPELARARAFVAR